MDACYVVLASLVAQEGSIAPTPHDQVVELEVRVDGPELIEGLGPTGILEHEVDFSGTLHLWTISTGNTLLRVDDVDSGEVLGFDRHSGPGETPYLRLKVESGDALAVLVAFEEESMDRSFSLHLAAAPETDDLVGVVREVEDRVEEIADLQRSGEHAAARLLIRENVDRLLRTPGHEYSEEVAVTLSKLGDMAEASAGHSVAVAARTVVSQHRTRTSPRDDLLQIQAWAKLGLSCARAGDPARAGPIFERLLEAYEQYPADAPYVFGALSNLATARTELGDLAGARFLQERLLLEWEDSMLEEGVLTARMNLATTMATMGDVEGGRAIMESVLENWEELPDRDELGVLLARQNLAAMMHAGGDSAGSRAMLESVLEVYERTVSQDHPELQRTRGNLAYVLDALGEEEEAAALEEIVLGHFERTLPAHHPDRLNALENVGLRKKSMGDYEGSRKVLEEALGALENLFPADHRTLLSLRYNLMGVLLRLEDLAGAQALASEQIDGMRTRVLAMTRLGTREVGEALRSDSGFLGPLLLSSHSGPGELRQSVWELVETMRMAPAESARLLAEHDDPKVRALLDESRALRAQLGELLTQTGSEADSSQVASQVRHLLERRDRVERQASLEIIRRGVQVHPVRIARLAGALSPTSAFVGYRNLNPWEGGGDRLLAHVVRHDRTLDRIDLGPSKELEALVVAWRDAVGVSSMQRGVRLTEAKAASAAEREIRGHLYARLLAPVLEVLEPEVERLHVCADDFVHLVPLDAMLRDDGELVGGRWSIVNEVSCARILSSGGEFVAGLRLLGVGGVDYDLPPDRESVTDGPSETKRSVASGFGLLAETGREVRSIAKSFEEAGGRAELLLAGQATKSALFDRAAGTTYLHVASHGWFAPELGTAEQRTAGSDWAGMPLGRRVSRMAPMLLCGLALAGANQPPDSLGRRPGILTAEELCALDLSECELAVLSACETNVGIRRAGQGIQSLQAALYAAGARSSITSLWKVDDAATRRLMELFYANLWEAKMPKARALWEAKRILREEGAPLRDWAGWVLTGDPD